MSCPICGKETLHAFRPFCSKRCADIDLAKWMNGSYAVPSERDEDVDDELDQAVPKPVRPH
ncbi:DNA gyrase inhibitor YacG [Ruegeria sp.]|uniref:DNA gyrase inhibitor YacG n=1 Tax=Ruegeria sp. TaxID=1879320 RepID=UPI003C7E2CDB